MHLAVGAEHPFCGVENNELKPDCVLNVILEAFRLDRHEYEICLKVFLRILKLNRYPERLHQLLIYQKS